MVPFKPFPAYWRNRDGTKNPNAGFQRNEDMALYAGSYGALIAIMYRDEPTTGTSDMIKRAEKCGLDIYIHWI